MRRSLFLLPLVVLPLLLAGCGGGGDDDDSEAAGTPTAFPTSVDPSDAIPTEQLGAINAVIAASEFVVGENNFVVGITNAEDQPEGGAAVTMTFFENANSAQQLERFTVTAVQSAPGVGEEIVHIHEGGEEHIHGGENEDRVGYYAKVVFDKPGTWGVRVDATLADGTDGAAAVAFAVLEAGNVPAPGEDAPRSDNLTAADVDDLSEIDSGNPPNDMHDVKIKDAIEAGRPVVVVFSTPAFCASRFCGPVTQEVELLRDEYGDAVDFVHIEIWLDYDAQLLNPTVREWLIRPDGGLSEPWVFVIGKDGVIYDRWEGPVAANIIEQAVADVAEGLTHAAG